MKPLPISAYTATSALGAGLAAQLAALRAGRSGLQRRRFESQDFDAWTGVVEGLDEVRLPPALSEWDCRVHRLAWLALQQDGMAEKIAAARARHGAARIGVFMGSSTAGIHHSERAFRERAADGTLPEWFSYRHSQDVNAIAEFVRLACGLEGPALAVSTACSSSAKVFASAQRAIAAGWCDAAIVGGADSLCLTTLYGFNALQLLSPDICRPADARRSGISIGEAAGYALLDPAADAHLALLGAGESGDAHHMSTPEPQGRGALLAMQRALDGAHLAPADIDYINLHGTATIANDAAEDKAVCALFGAGTPASSTKGYSGHTLGAAGMLEAAFSLLAVEHGLMPGSITTQEKDPALGGTILLRSRAAPVRRALSNSFGFGGSNCALVLGQRT